MCRLICNRPELNIRICDPLKIPLFYESKERKAGAELNQA